MSTAVDQEIKSLEIRLERIEKLITTSKSEKSVLESFQEIQNDVEHLKGTHRQIRELFKKLELADLSYDNIADVLEEPRKLSVELQWELLLLHKSELLEAHNYGKKIMSLSDFASSKNMENLSKQSEILAKLDGEFHAMVPKITALVDRSTSLLTRNYEFVNTTSKIFVNYSLKK